MGGDGAAQPGGATLPSRQTWCPARSQGYVTTFTAMSVVAAFLAVLWLTDNDRDSVVLIASAYGLQSEVFAMVAWVHRRSRLRADPTGLHWDTGLRTRTYPWEDITEIRPSIARGKRTFLVLVRGNHEVVDLPVTEEHLDELRRWHAAQG